MYFGLEIYLIYLLLPISITLAMATHRKIDFNHIKKYIFCFLNQNVQVTSRKTRSLFVNVTVFFLDSYTFEK
jgi:hypothetical protein